MVMKLNFNLIFWSLPPFDRSQKMDVYMWCKSPFPNHIRSNMDDIVWFVKKQSIWESEYIRYSLLKQLVHFPLCNEKYYFSRHLRAGCIACTGTCISVFWTELGKNDIQLRKWYKVYIRMTKLLVDLKYGFMI